MSLSAAKIALSMEATSVYRYFDCVGRLVYVGVTKRGVQRAHEHAKTKDWWPLVTGSTVEHFATREEALEREAELIQRHRPLANIQHNRPRVKSIVIERPREVSRADSKRVPKEVIRAWYALSPEEKRVTPCVECGQRPGVRGPRCMVCLKR